MIIVSVSSNFGAFSVGSNAGGGRYVQLIAETEKEAEIIGGVIGEENKIYFRGIRNWAGMPTDGGYTQEFRALCDYFGIKVDSYEFMSYCKERFNAQVEEVRKSEGQWFMKNKYYWKEYRNGINMVISRYSDSIRFTSFPTEEWKNNNEGLLWKCDPEIRYRTFKGIACAQVIKDYKDYYWRVEENGRIKYAFCVNDLEARCITEMPDGVAEKIEPSDIPPGAKIEVSEY